MLLERSRSSHTWGMTALNSTWPSMQTGASSAGVGSVSMGFSSIASSNSQRPLAEHCPTSQSASLVQVPTPASCSSVVWVGWLGIVVSIPGFSLAARQPWSANAAPALKAQLNNQPLANPRFMRPTPLTKFR
jgi:hypothetical protein